jgi:hypothetical protein
MSNLYFVCPEQSRLATTFVPFELAELRENASATLSLWCDRCSRMHAVSREATVYAREKVAALGV